MTLPVWTRVAQMRPELERLQLESERLQLTELSINESEKLTTLINDFVEQLREIGPNPYKGM